MFATRQFIDGYKNTVKFFIFFGKRVTVKNVGFQLERNDLGTHTLRKTFGYNYYLKTKDIGTLMIIFNHSSKQITKHYLGITDQQIGKIKELIR